MDTLSSSFTRWLFRPYLDLSTPDADAPFHVWGLQFAFRSYVEDTEYPQIQASFNPSFRRMLVRDAALPLYAGETPLAVPPDLRSREWNGLCAAVETFHDLAPRQQARVAWTLTKMGFHRAAVSLIPASAGACDPDRAALAFVRVYARYRMNVDDASAPYRIDEFKQLAVESPPGITRIDATYQVVVQNVKHTGDFNEVLCWQAKHLEAVEQSAGVLDEFTYTFAMSRYHRVGGFIPQMRRDPQGIVEEMDRAEAFASALPRTTEVLAIAADEVMYPVIESRIKEALWLGDTDRALARATRLTTLSPCDARAWLELGEVYLEAERYADARRAYGRAYRLAPPGREVALFMIGQCDEALGDLDAACDAYVGALELDPLCISAAEQLVEIARSTGRVSLLRWIEPRLGELHAMQTSTAPARRWPYKDLPSPATSA